MKQELIKYLTNTAKNIGIEASEITLEYPENPEHGDYSSNIAMVYGKSLKMAPKVLADKISVEFNKNRPDFIESVSVAGPGFINFKVKDIVFANMMLSEGDKDFLKSSAEVQTSTSNKVMVEYTDPNPFKIFHIGHLMSNAIGESISRLMEYTGANVIRACYQGDVGLHVAKTLYAVMSRKQSDEYPKESDSVVSKVDFLGKMYVIGSLAYEDDPAAKKDIETINKKIFEKSDSEINNVYEQGRTWSLNYFDTIYRRLGTSFNNFFFESEVAKSGEDIVKKFSKRSLFRKAVFTKSDGAIVFKGEDHGLHTRVFITSQGLPAYEAKELGLNAQKFKLYPDLKRSIVITASEQSEYFKVVLKAISFINPTIYSKTKHMSHGMLRFADGKMSSRKGNIIPAETLIDDIKKLVLERISNKDFSEQEANEVGDLIAIAAIKYTILRQTVGSDVIFDSAKSISFEGDSGPYLQYSVVRANSVIEKAKNAGIQGSIINSQIKLPEKVGILEKLIARFPDIIARATNEYAPQYVANYLINLAGAYNSFYAGNTIVDTNEPLSAYRIELTKKFINIMTEGLYILGIKIPKKM